MKRILSAAFGVAAFFIGSTGVSSGPAQALEADLIQTGNGGIVLLLEGQITPGDDKKIIPMLQAGGFEEVWLDSPGGHVTTGYAIGKEIRRQLLVTRVTSDGFCASSCVDVFLGGVVRFVDEGGVVAIHPASVSRDRVMQQTVLRSKTPEEAMATIQTFEKLATEETAEWTQYLNFMGVRVELIERAAEVRHGCVIVLSQPEMIYFNVINTGGKPPTDFVLGDAIRLCEN